jgi:drug/metabolite transporter (DMT)-like permease
VASICYPIAKVGLAQIEPFTFAFYRFILSTIVLLLIVRLQGHTTRIERKDWPRIFLMAILIIPFNQTFFLLGQSLTAAGHGAFLFATTPVWVFILAMLHLGEKPSLRRKLGAALALGGTLAIMSSGAIEVGSEYLLGDAIILVSVLAWAYYSILGKPLVRKYGAFRMTAYPIALGSLLYSPFGLYRAIICDYSQATPFAWFSIAYMAIGLSVIVYSIWYWLLKWMDATRVAVFQNAQPILASLVAYVFLSEPLGTIFVIGGSVVIAGVLLSELRTGPGLPATGARSPL